jgi:hypothetical protein
MDNIISIIECLGADSNFRMNSADVLQRQASDMSEVTEAINNGDVKKLELILNVRNKIVCMIFPVEEPKEQPEQPDEDDEPEEDKTAVAV